MKRSARSKRSWQLEFLERRELLAADGLAPILQSFSAEVLQSQQSSTYRLTALDSNNSEDAVTIRWDFGDGSPVQFGSEVTHAFDVAGQYVVTATATDVDGVPAVQRAIVDSRWSLGLRASYEDADPLNWQFVSSSGEPIFFGVSQSLIPPGANPGSVFVAQFETQGLYQITAISGPTIFLPFIGGNDAPLPSIAISNTVDANNVRLDVQLSGLSDSQSEVKINWGYFGDTYQLNTTGFDLSFDYAYALGGDYQIDLQVQNSGFFWREIIDVHISRILQLGDVVSIEGTGGNDILVVRQVSGGQVRFEFGGDTLTVRKQQVQEIQAYLGDGNDTVTVVGNVAINMQIYGQEGDDSITSGSGDDVLVGGPGNDLLNGRNGSDLLVGGEGNDQLFGGNDDDFLIGGLGEDRLFGEQGSDLLIGGTTVYDSDITSLQLIRLTWQGSGSFAQRSSRIANGTGPFLAGTGIRLRPNIEVLNDNEVDQYFAAGNNDWILTS